MVKNPSCNVGDASSIPGQGTKIPHATGQLSPHAATTEPTRSEAHKPLESPRATTKTQRKASLVAQWLRIRLPMQATQARTLVLEDPTCHGATKPVCHNY